MWPFKKKTPVQLMKQQRDREFIEALRCIALEVSGGRMTNHGLSVYGAHKLYESGRKPNVLERRVLLDDGTFLPYDLWVEIKYPSN